jgi:hypothetical protein
MQPAHLSERPEPSILPVLYVGHDLTPERRQALRFEGIGVVVAKSAEHARRLLTQFKVASVIFTLPDLQAIAVLPGDVPIVILAACDAVSGTEAITIIKRTTDPSIVARAIRRIAARGQAPERPNAA